MPANKFVNKVLIIDDATSVFLTQNTLEEMNITRQILTALDGKEGLDKLKEYCFDQQVAPTDCPDIILLDSNMPVMNGFELLEELSHIDQSNLIRARVIVLTTSSNATDIDIINALGVRNYLAKPLTDCFFRYTQPNHSDCSRGLKGQVV